MIGGCGVDAGDRIESTSNRLRPINLFAKRAGERSAGNPHAPFDVAGNGNQLTVRLVGILRGNGEQRIDRTYGEWRHSSTLPGRVRRMILSVGAAFRR